MWLIAARKLKEHDLPVARGRENTTKFLVEFALKSDSNFAQVVEFISEMNFVIKAGNKSITFYEPYNFENSEIIKHLSDLNTSDSRFSKKYPLPLTDTELAKVGSTPQLTHIDKRSDGIYLVYCTKRTTVREVELPESILNQFSDIKLSKVTGHESIDRQHFDTVFIPTDGNIEIRIDTSGSLHVKEILSAHSQIHTAFNATCADSLGNHVLGPIKNLFSLIDNYYKAKKEGIVEELHFECSTGTIRREILKRDRKDLRTEEFHLAGKSAIKAITPFRIGISWPRKKSEAAISHPSLLLPGLLKMARDSVKFPLYTAQIENAESEDDFNFVLDKIRSKL